MRGSAFSRPTHRRRGRGRRSTGFTLIEILVVVAIIALLAAILLPSLSHARWYTRNTVCRANLHDLGNAFTMYANAYKGFFPITDSAGSDSYFAVWKARLLKNVDILICPGTENVIRPETLKWPERHDRHSPEDPSVAIPYLGLSASEMSDIDDAAESGANDNSGGHSYEYNGCYDSARKNSAGDPIHALSRCHKRSTHFTLPPHQTMLVHDNDDRCENQPGYFAGCEDSLFGNGNNCPQPWDNHGSLGMNMMFTDGHAEWLKKLPGTYENTRMRSDTGSGPMITSNNASIDRVWLKSQYPREYIRSRR